MKKSKSLIGRLNKKGPSIEPCGTADIIKKTFFLIFNTLGWFQHDSKILSMTPLSFKDPSVVPVLLGLFPQLF